MTPSAAISKLIEVCRRQHKSLQTERSYAGWLRRYVRFITVRRPEGTSAQKVEAFLTQLAKQDVAASTQNQAFNALVFFYKDVVEQPLGNVDALRASRPKQIRHAPNLGDTRRLLDTVDDWAGYPTALIVRLLYGCGLRVGEPLELRVKDVDFEGSKLFILGAKGRKDRVVAMPCSAAEDLRGQLDYARAIWKRDQVGRVPVQLPHLLAQKYPENRFAWAWAWVFPGHQPCRDPRTGEIVRWHCLADNVQRAVKAAREKLGLSVRPHELRHAYATHSLDRGVNIKALSEAMGHEQIETTAGYCHAEALSVPSPLESMFGLRNETQRTSGPARLLRTAPMAMPGRAPPATAAGRALPDGRTGNESCNAAIPVSSEIVIEIPDRTPLRSQDSEWRAGETQLGRSPASHRARQEQAYTDQAVAVAMTYRADGYVMDKLARAPGMSQELMAGRTPMARKFAILYATKPDDARQYLAAALEKPGNPRAWLNTVVAASGVRY